MIHSLDARVTFATSGFTLDTKFQPLTGITAVVGPNGAGKTFSTIELTRYLLYGKKALRGPAKGYKNLEAKGEFTIRGNRYRIERTPEHEFIEDADGTILAVNATAVTEKATELMGYGLDVFDVCNASVQGDSHLFSKMQPAERKRMIDRVVGLASNEVIEKACRAEASVLKRTVDAMTSTLVVPIGPTARFVGFSDDIQAQLTAGREAAAKYQKLNALMVRVAKPVKPDMPMPAEIDIRMTQDHEDHRRDVERQRKAFQDFLDKPYPAVEYDAVQIEQAEARYLAKVKLENLGRKPALTMEEIEQYQREWAIYETHADGTCPNCGWDLGADSVKPDVSKELLREDARAHARWDGVDVIIPDGPDLSAAEIRAAKLALETMQARQDAVQRLSELPVLDDRSAQLDRLRGRKSQWKVYLEQAARYDDENQANLEAEAELEQLGVVPTNEELDQLAADMAEALLFESQWRSYNAAKIIYDTAMIEIEDKRKLAEEFSKGGAALADARTAIKAFLAPALARATSSLLYDMTHGKLSDVSIDDDMNILVGAQTLETLSGGGLTAANIALRIALGQVLVADTFPVFLGDEIDADVDPIRREAIIEALVGLKQHLSQIILVTHRGVDVADHTYDLGNA